MSNYSLTQIKAELDPRQQKAAMLIVENEFLTKETGRRSLEDIAQEIGVSRQSLHTWRQSPYFRAYMNHLSDERLDSRRAEVDAALFKLIQGGNNGLPAIKALELYYKLSGRLVDKQVVETIDGNKPELSQEQIDSGIEELAKKLRG